jgi:hypothetical protein
MTYAVAQFRADDAMQPEVSYATVADVPPPGSDLFFEGGAVGCGRCVVVPWQGFVVGDR